MALIGAVEVAWRNADKRDRFNLTALDDYVWRRDDTYGKESVIQIIMPNELVTFYSPRASLDTSLV